MKIVELKIQPRFYELIKNGVKKYEVRKRNKDYLYRNDVIRFIDLDGKELGYARVKIKFWNSPVFMNQMDMDDETFKFVKENYINEEVVAIFEIEPLEVIYAK